MVKTFIVGNHTKKSIKALNLSLLCQLKGLTGSFKAADWASSQEVTDYSLVPPGPPFKGRLQIFGFLAILKF